MRTSICRRDDGTMVNQCPPGHFFCGVVFPVTPARCALRCHGLRVNQRPPDARGMCRGNSDAGGLIQSMPGGGFGGRGGGWGI